MKTRSIATGSVAGILFAATLLAPPRSGAQAGPGPIAPVPQSQGRSTGAPPQSAARPRQPQLPPRTTLAGSWKLNHDDSDDGRQKVRAAEGSTGQNRRDPNGGYPGGGYPGGGYPGGGYPGGNGPWGGYPYPSGGGPSGGRLGGGPSHEDDAKMQPLVNPSESLAIDLKNPEVDLTDDQFQKLVLFTDGRQLPKSSPKDEQDAAAHWSGSQLVSDEKSPLGGRMSRTFELSQDGRQMYETLHIENGKKKAIVIRYVYDVSRPDTEGGQESDPDRPVLKRNSDDGNNPPQ